MDVETQRSVGQLHMETDSTCTDGMGGGVQTVRNGNQNINGRHKYTNGAGPAGEVQLLQRFLFTGMTPVKLVRSLVFDGEKLKSAPF